MEERTIRVIFHKAGNGRGAKVTIPIPWLREIEVSEDEREVILQYNKKNKEIVLRKKK